MDMRVQLDRIDQALLQAHQERTRYRQAPMDAYQLPRADVVLLALMGTCVFVWTMGAITLGLRLAGYS